MNEYQFLKTTLISAMDSLMRIIAKAETLTTDGKMTEKDILETRLAPDMFPFVSQIRIATDDARRNLFLLAGKEHVKMEDTETTFAELRERIIKTKALLESITDEDLVGADERKISLYWMGGAYVFGKDFVQQFATVNTLFHVVTAYNIVRHLGAQIGKMDLLGSLSMHKD